MVYSVTVVSASWVSVVVTGAWVVIGEPQPPTQEVTTIVEVTRTVETKVVPLWVMVFFTGQVVTVV